MDKSTPKVVKIHDVNIDKDYIGWIEELKSRYRKAQIKAAVKVNAEQLLFNWQLGRDLVIRKAEDAVRRNNGIKIQSITKTCFIYRVCEIGLYFSFSTV